MILLLGGTSETAEIADALAGAGFGVLVSTATDNRLDTGKSENIERRTGRMDESAMAALIEEKKITAVVDATHPFAEIAGRTGASAARKKNVSYFRYLRKTQVYDYEKITRVANHEMAAHAAFEFGRPVLLTTGSRNLAVYVEQSRKAGVKIMARVLPHDESREACRRAGLKEDEVISARGPFNVDENLEVIINYGIGTLVTKDSGAAGGVNEKVEAAKMADCRVVLIERPPESVKHSYEMVSELVAAVNKDCGK